MAVRVTQSEMVVSYVPPPLKQRLQRHVFEQRMAGQKQASESRFAEEAIAERLDRLERRPPKPQSKSPKSHRG